jgi:uncharacterized protein YkwD
MEKSSVISTITLIFVVATMVLLLKTNNVPSMFLPSEKPKNAVPVLQLPTKQIEPKVVMPGGVRKPTVNTIDAGVLPSDYSLTRTGIIAQTNSERSKNAKTKLTENKALDRSAQVKAEDMLKRQYFAHEAPDGRTVSDLVDDQGYAYLKIGENLALGNFASDADVVTAWMNSPGHRANILDGQYTEIGVGVARGLYEGHTVYFAVQHFGRPRSACPSVQSNLISQFTIAQKYLDELIDSIDAQKKVIDQGSGNTNEMNALIEKYNATVTLYKNSFQKAEELRAKYNAEVTAYNACLGSL